MKKLAIVFALGAAAVMGSSAANAAEKSSKAPVAANQFPTDISSQHRHWRGHRHWGHRYWGHRHYRPYYNSYGYAPRSYGYYGGPRYYGGGPGVTFSFGGGRW